MPNHAWKSRYALHLRCLSWCIKWQFFFLFPAAAETRSQSQAFHRNGQPHQPRSKCCRLSLNCAPPSIRTPPSIHVPEYDDHANVGPGVPAILSTWERPWRILRNMGCSSTYSDVQLAAASAAAIECVLKSYTQTHHSYRLLLDTRYYVNNHQTGQTREVLPPISSFFGPATSPVDWPTRPSSGVSHSTLPPPELVRPTLPTLPTPLAPVTTQIPANTQQPCLSAEGFTPPSSSLLTTLTSLCR